VSLRSRVVFRGKANTTPAVMATGEKEHSCSQDSNNHAYAGKFVYPLSIFSLLICITAMVRVEIINQRIDVVEDFMAEVNQIANVHVRRDVTGLKNVQKVNLVDEFYRKNGVKEEEYTSKGKLNPLQYFTGGGDSHANGMGMTMGKLELNLLRSHRPIWVLYSLFVPPVNLSVGTTFNWRDF